MTDVDELIFGRCAHVPAGSPSHGGDVSVFVYDITTRACPLLFILFLCLFMALSTVFHSINFPDNSPLSHSVLPVLFLPYWSFQLHVVFIRLLDILTVKPYTKMYFIGDS